MSRPQDSEPMDIDPPEVSRPIDTTQKATEATTEPMTEAPNGFPPQAEQPEQPEQLPPKTDFPFSSPTETTSTPMGQKTTKPAQADSVPPPRTGPSFPSQSEFTFTSPQPQSSTSASPESPFNTAPRGPAPDTQPQEKQDKGKEKETQETEPPTPPPEPITFSKPGSQLDPSSLSVRELEALLDKALELKKAGNAAFTSKPAKLDVALKDYQAALDELPAVPKHLPPPSPDEERIREVSDEEADQIEADFKAGPARIRVDNEIRDTTKVMWANLGAVYSTQKKYKETVAACTKALSFDPHYLKALLRRAAANEHIGTWGALSSARQDYGLLSILLPPDDKNLVNVRKSLDELPRKIMKQQEQEKEDLVGKMGSL